MSDRSVTEESGSFRDRDGRVFYADGEVYRTLAASALEDWHKLAKTAFFARLVREKRIVATEEVALASIGVAGRAALDGWAGALHHARVPFISYPYEWCFGMLRDAALLELELMDAALAEDLILKDATPYNVQWIGSRAQFIDVGSFTRFVPGQVWAGYRQFCELFLYPLFLQAYKGVAFQPWLRGSLDGIPAAEFRALMSWRDVLRPGVLLHVSLQAAMQSRHADTKRDVKRDLSASGFHKELIVANVKKLTRLVRGLRWEPPRSQWSEYTRENSYDDADHAKKMEFVARVAGERRRKLVWDLGCNTGEYSRIARAHADCVVAMDADHLAVERMYRSLVAEQDEVVVPLCVNLSDSSPSQGWRGAERKDLLARGRPELVLALALIHHMVIAANVPMESFVGWLGDLGGELVIEFVTKQDPMVETLLRNKEDKYSDYDQARFEAALADRFDVAAKQPLAGGRRALYHARPKRAYGVR